MQLAEPITIGLPFSDQPVGQFGLAVRSIFAQTDQNWRLILSADGPSDNLALARKIDDPRVTLLENATRGGLAAALNRIATAAQTSHLLRMDADDVMHPRRVAVMAEYFTSHPHTDVVGSRAWLIDETDEVRGVFREGTTLPATPAGYLKSNAFTHPTVGAKTEWFLRNPYDESLTRSQDKALWLTSNRSSVFEKVDDRLLFYRVDTRLSAQRQAMSSKYDRRLLWRYGRAIDSFAAMRRIGTSMVKQQIFAAMVASGRAGRLYDRKYDIVPMNDLAAAQADLDACSAAEIPGWEVASSTTDFD